MGYFSAETSWDIVDSSGTTIDGDNNLANTMTYTTEPLCLPNDGCYTATIYDTYGDGCVQ